MIRPFATLLSMAVLVSCGHQAPETDASSSKGLVRASLTIKPFDLKFAQSNTELVAATVPTATLLLQCGEATFGGATLNQVRAEMPLKAEKTEDGGLRLVNELKGHIEAKTYSLLSFCDSHLRLVYPAGASAAGEQRAEIAVTVPGVGIDKVFNFGQVTPQIIANLDGGALTFGQTPWPADSTTTCRRNATFKDKNGKEFAFHTYTSDYEAKPCG